MEEIKATLRLFNSVLVDNKRHEAAHQSEVVHCIKNGYICDSAVSASVYMLNLIDDVVGISGEKLNQSFHKSWHKVANASIEQLFLEQILHYITTYGFESFGIHTEDLVFVPAEKLDIPGISEDIPLVVIHGLFPIEILQKIIKLGSGVALHKDTLDDLMVIIEHLGYGPAQYNEIKNHELNARIASYFGIVPSNPVDFLRYMMTELTENSLLIKDAATINRLKLCPASQIDELLTKAPGNLAEIFFRFKPLFLAMKKASNNKSFFNQLRRKANKIHKPMKEDFLNTVTAQKGIDLQRLDKELSKVNVYRKVRLLNALMYTGNHIMYRIRNGKAWVAATPAHRGTSHFNGAATTVLDSIIYNMDVNHKVFYIPEGVVYGVPTSEKMFVGHIPNNSYVEVGDNLLAGIYWKNVDRRIDLDLAMNSVAGKMGWDGGWRSQEILFSGDVVDAPKGATEVFYIKNTLINPQLMTVNFFNHRDEGTVVPTKVFVARDPERYGMLRKNYVVDPNLILATVNINITEKENVLGLVLPVGDKNRFYFTNVSLGNNVSSREDWIVAAGRECLIDQVSGLVDLNTVLLAGGAAIVNYRPEEGEEYIDLSPEALDKTTILDLIHG